jgi:hypothetical protein
MLNFQKKLSGLIEKYYGRNGAKSTQRIAEIFKVRVFRKGFSFVVIFVSMGLSVVMTGLVYGQAGLKVVSTTKKTRRASIEFVPITAQVRSGDRVKKITLVGRKDDAVIFTESDTGVGVRLSLSADKIEKMTFALKYAPTDIYKYVRDKEWNSAVRYLLPIVKPTFPYLDVANNNAVELSLELGTYMMNSAKQQRRQAKTDAQRKLVKKQYAGAYGVMKHVAKAEWSPLSNVAALRQVECLLELRKAKTAARQFSDILEPEISDIYYGRYWLMAARLKLVQQKYREAMGAAVKSVCFQNKDVATFPDALLITAQCHEEMQDWFRARDIYYEVARVFPRTEWSEIAIRRLRFIIKNGFTEKEEKSPIQNVFFGLNEDVNELVKELLEKKEEPVVKTIEKKKRVEKVNLDEEE